MPRLTQLPLRKTMILRNDRDNLLLYIRSKDINGVVNDLSGYTFAGKVKAERAVDAADICDVTFDNDLANGIVKGYISDADAQLCLTAVADGGTVYADIVRTNPSGFDDQIAEYTLTVADVVTPVGVSS